MCADFVVHSAGHTECSEDGLPGEFGYGPPLRSLICSAFGATGSHEGTVTKNKN